MIFLLDFGNVLMAWNYFYFFIIICRLTKYMPIWTIRPLIDNKAYLMTTVVYFFFQCPPRFPCQRLFVYFNSNTRGVSCGTGTAYPSRAPEFTPGFLWGSCCSIFSFLCNVLQIVVCPFVYFLIATMVPV